MSSPAVRTIAELKKRGFTCHKVEHWNSFAKIRQDFGGFADFLAYKDGEPGVLAINCCLDDGSVQKHIDKFKANANVKVWLKAMNKFQIWGWGLRSKDGIRGSKKVWTLRIVPFEFEVVEIEPAQLNGHREDLSGDIPAN